MGVGTWYLGIPDGLFELSSSGSDNAVSWCLIGCKGTRSTEVRADGSDSLKGLNTIMRSLNSSRSLMSVVSLGTLLLSLSLISPSSGCFAMYCSWIVLTEILPWHFIHRKSSSRYTWVAGWTTYLSTATQYVVDLVFWFLGSNANTIS